jgi:methionyl-tRNA formyltransferase
MRIVFMGSPEFALPSLTALSKNYRVVGVVTQPDRPAGRGKILTPPPVKTLALSLNIPVIQPEKLKDPSAMEQLLAWQPELIVVAAFGQILRQNVLAMPPLGCINIHASLLPRWRGAAPIQAAILNGDAQTGVTIMMMDAGVDTGAILSQRGESIRNDDTSGILGERLSKIGAELLIETLPLYLNKSITPQIQPEQGMTYAAMLNKEDARLDFSQTAQSLDRKIRAYNPWPGAFTVWRGNPLKLLKTHVIKSPAIAPVTPGSTLVIDQKPAIQTSSGILVLDEIQPAGKKILSGSTFLQGARSWGNDILQ